MPRPKIARPRAFPSVEELRRIRELLVRGPRGLRWGWVIFGVLVVVGAAIVGCAASLLCCRVAQIDLSRIDSRTGATTLPVILLAAGPLFGFLVAGFLLARGSGLPKISEIATSAAIVICAGVVGFGAFSPIAMVFSAVIGPLAFFLACFGGWLGRVRRWGNHLTN